MDRRNDDARVCSPLLPPLEDFLPYLQDIWARGWLTNGARYVDQLETALATYLGVPYVSVFTNGTLALVCALRALGLEGEVITTPYTFVATAHAISWCGLRPVFVDVDPVTCNLDPARVEAAITPETRAILPVHCYGMPCDTERIAEVAARHGLKVLYDAAHAFGVEVNGAGLASAGDMSVLSFHATKVYNTVEGGAVVCHRAEDKAQLDLLRNFGFAGEERVLLPGLNAKMDELRAAYGLLNLRGVDAAIAARGEVVARYRRALRGVEGISLLGDMEGVRHNYCYFPIFVDAPRFGTSRDGLYARLKAAGIGCRRYFYPLVCDMEAYADFAGLEGVEVARARSAGVICLPLWSGMEEGEVERVLGCILE